jgi:hypothetical protein
MTIVSCDQLSSDMQSSARQLIDQIGIIPQAQDRPLDANDLLFYISETSMPMATFMRKHGLFMDADGLHFDLAQFNAIRDLAKKVITEHEAGNLDGVWRELDLSGDEDVDSTVVTSGPRLLHLSSCMVRRNNRSARRNWRR